ATRDLCARGCALCPSPGIRQDSSEFRQSAASERTGKFKRCAGPLSDRAREDRRRKWRIPQFRRQPKFGRTEATARLLRGAIPKYVRWYAFQKLLAWLWIRRRHRAEL